MPKDILKSRSKTKLNKHKHVYANKILRIVKKYIIKTS